MNTAAIQKAIDQCTKDGGGTVLLSGGGKFMTGTIYLKDNVTLHIDNIKDSGLKIQMNEGGEMKNMVFSNLVMENVPRPILMTFCQQRACVDSPRELAPMKAMHHFIFNQTGLPGSR